MKKYLLYLKKHADFIVLDLITLILGYYAVVQFRYAINPVWHGELFLDYGVVLTGVYLVILIFSKNLSGIIVRSFFKEIRALFIQLFVSWAFFTVVLYSVKSAQDFSRTVYGSAFVICFIFLLVERSAWKCIIRFGRFHTYLCPKLIIVCDGDKSQAAIKRMLHGAFENDYEIVGVVLTDTEECDYIDHFPVVKGLDNLADFIKDKKVDEAFVELSNSEDETRIIEDLLNHDIVAHKSLGDSVMNYVEQDIEVISEHYVLTVRDTKVSFVTRAEKLETEIFRKLARRK